MIPVINDLMTGLCSSLHMTGDVFIDNKDAFLLVHLMILCEIIHLCFEFFQAQNQAAGFRLLIYIFL